MRRKVVAGNWKMNKSLHESVELAEGILRGLNIARSGQTQVIVSPPFTNIYRTHEILANRPMIAIAGQNCHSEESGAYTGEISAAMLRSLGVEYVILGHSERRQYFGETNELIAQKVKRALENGLKPIFCCGESLEERENDKYFTVVQKQLSAAISEIEPKRMKRVIIAYEPVWAIGTGKTASPEQAQEMHAFIRKQVAEKFGEEQANRTTILYGGSCKPDNAAELFAMEDIDGGLIGGASLKAEDFLEIVYACAG